MSEAGKYIVIEGHDATGKTEQAKIIRERLKKIGVKVCNFLIEEPDGATTEDGVSLVPIATEIRKVIKNGNLPRDPYVNVQLFTAARRANWIQAIEPALERGEWVVSARSWWSTVAYQGYGEGVSLDLIENTYSLSVGGERYLHPDLGLILDVDHDIRHERIAMRGPLENPDTFESRPDDFQQRIKDGYLAFAESRNIPIVDASGSLQDVNDRIWSHVESLIATE